MINNHSAAHWEQQPLLRIPNPSPGIPGIPSMFLGKDSRRLLFGADAVWLCHRRSFGVKKVVFLGVWNFMKNLQKNGKGHGQMGYSQLLRCWTLEVGISGITSCHICIYGECCGKKPAPLAMPQLTIGWYWVQNCNRKTLGIVSGKSLYLQSPYHSICSKTQRSPTVKNGVGLLLSAGPQRNGKAEDIIFIAPWILTLIGEGIHQAKLFFGMRKWYYNLYSN